MNFLKHIKSRNFDEDQLPIDTCKTKGNTKHKMGCKFLKNLPSLALNHAIEESIP